MVENDITIIIAEMVVGHFAAKLMYPKGSNKIIIFQ